MNYIVLNVLLDIVSIMLAVISVSMATAILLTILIDLIIYLHEQNFKRKFLKSIDKLEYKEQLWLKEKGE